MKKLHVKIVAAAMLTLTACSGSQSDDIAVAEVAVAETDYAAAKKICDDIYVACDSTAPVTDLCRLSIVYMKLSDIAAEDENTALATQCYRMALAADRDSAIAFYRSLPIDEAQHVEIMSTLEQWFDGNRDITAENDSIFPEIYEIPDSTAAMKPNE